MPRKATTTATTADEYDGPAKRTRGAQRAANPVFAPVPVPVAAQRHSSIPATRATRCVSTVRAAVKKQTKAATKTKPKRKTTSTRKPSAAIKSADAPSPSKARATRATRKVTSGDALPTPDRPIQEQPSRSADNVAIDNKKEVKIVDDDGAKRNDVPPLPSRGRNGIKPVAAAPLPTTPKTPTRRSKKSAPSAGAPADDEGAEHPTTPIAAKPGPSTTAIPLATSAAAATAGKVPPLPSRKKQAVAPTTSTDPATGPILPTADTSAAAASKVPPLPSRKKRAVAPTTSTGFRIVAPRPDTPAPDNNTSTPARRPPKVNGNDKTLSPRDENVAAEDDVKPTIDDLREEESQDLGNIKHSGNENISPVFEGANAVVDAFNHAARANDRTRPRPSTRASGKAKANVVPPLPSRKAPAAQAPPAAASSSRVPPLPHRSTNNVPPLPSRPRRAPLGAEQRGATSSQQAPAGGSQEVRRVSIEFTIKVKTEEQTDGKVPPADDAVKIEETSSEDEEEKAEERKRLRAWQETSDERDSRTRNWVASVNEERQNPGKRRREDNAQEVAYDIQNDREVNKLAKRRRISDEEVEIKAECVDEDTPARTISQAEKNKEFVKSRTGSWGCWSPSRVGSTLDVAEDIDREESQEV